jgi:hypothetical protein
MMDHSGRDPVETNETEAAKHAFFAHHLGQCFFIPESILQGQHRGAGSKERGQQPRELGVGGGLQPDEHKVAGPDLGRVLGASRVYKKSARVIDDADAVCAHGSEIRAQEQMNIPPGPSEAGAIKASQRAATHDADAGMSHPEKKEAPQITGCLATGIQF